MPGCCEVGDLDAIFSPSRAESDARGYRKKGLAGQSRRIFRALVARGVQARTVLEVGGGVGALQLELLKHGASHATNIELSRSYEPSARRLIDEEGLADRIDRRNGDFVADADAVAAADIVVLDRVVCCYPDVQALVSAAADHAHDVLVLTFPVERWWMRAGRELINVWPRITRSRFRFFVHPTRAVIAAAESRGMRLMSRDGALVWQMLLFAR